jgi:hypothetical protein
LPSYPLTSRVLSCPLLPSLSHITIGEHPQSQRARRDARRASSGHSRRAQLDARRGSLGPPPTSTKGRRAPPSCRLAAIDERDVTLHRAAADESDAMQGSAEPPLPSEARPGRHRRARGGLGQVADDERDARTAPPGHRRQARGGGAVLGGLRPAVVDERKEARHKESSAGPSWTLVRRSPPGCRR